MIKHALLALSIASVIILSAIGCTEAARTAAASVTDAVLGSGSGAQTSTIITAAANALGVLTGHQEKKPVDWVGAITAGASLAAAIYASILHRRLERKLSGSAGTTSEPPNTTKGPHFENRIPQSQTLVGPIEPDGPRQPT